jgi:hypothetical protein
MNTEQVAALIAAIAALISLLALGFSIYFSRKASSSANEANQQAKIANDVAMGQEENDLRRDIANSKIRYEDICAEAEGITQEKSLQELTPEERKQLTPKLKRMKSYLEEYLNAYENACSKYLDKKIDTTRFKKSYVSEIRKLFEPPTNAFKDFLHPEGTSRFKALWKVYKEWNDLENN